MDVEWISEQIAGNLFWSQLSILFVCAVDLFSFFRLLQGLYSLFVFLLLNFHPNILAYNWFDFDLSFILEWAWMYYPNYDFFVIEKQTVRENLPSRIIMCVRVIFVVCFFSRPLYSPRIRCIAKTSKTTHASTHSHTHTLEQTYEYIICLKRYEANHFKH